MFKSQSWAQIWDFETNLRTPTDNHDLRFIGGDISKGTNLRFEPKSEIWVLVNIGCKSDYFHGFRFATFVDPICDPQQISNTAEKLRVRLLSWIQIHNFCGSVTHNKYQTPLKSWESQLFNGVSGWTRVKDPIKLRTYGSCGFRLKSTPTGREVMSYFLCAGRTDPITFVPLTTGKPHLHGYLAGFLLEVPMQAWSLNSTMQ